MNNETILYKNGFTDDIINSIKSVFSESWTQTKNLAKELKGRDENETFLNIWNYTNKVNYILDPYGKQYIKTPNRFLRDNFGDCKSFSIFICSIFANLGYKTKFRFVSYSINSNYSHVYPIIILDNWEIPFDIVATKQVNCEPFKEVNYLKKLDIMNNECSTQISKLSGIIEVDSAYKKSENFVFEISNNETLSTILIKSFAFRYYNNRVFRTTEYCNLLLYGIEKSLYNPDYIDRISIFIAYHFYPYFKISKYGGSPSNENNKKALDYFVENQIFDNDYIKGMQNEIDTDEDYLKFWYMTRYYFLDSFNQRVNTSDNQDFDTINNILNCWAWFFPLCFDEYSLKKTEREQYSYLYNLINAMIQNTNIEYNSAINFIIGKCRLDTGYYPSDVAGLYVDDYDLNKKYKDIFVSGIGGNSENGENAAKDIAEAVANDSKNESDPEGTKKFLSVVDALKDIGSNLFDALGKLWGNKSSDSSSSDNNIADILKAANSNNNSNNFTSYLILGALGLGLFYMVSKKKTKK